MEKGIPNVFEVLNEKLGQLKFDLWFANEQLKDIRKENEGLAAENKVLVEQIATLTEKLTEMNSCTLGHCKAVTSDE